MPLGVGWSGSLLLPSSRHTGPPDSMARPLPQVAIERQLPGLPPTMVAPLPSPSPFTLS